MKILLIIYFGTYGVINVILFAVDVVSIVFKGDMDAPARIFNKQYGSIRKTVYTTGMNKIGSLLFMIAVPFIYFDSIFVYLYNLFQKEKKPMI